MEKQQVIFIRIVAIMLILIAFFGGTRYSIEKVKKEGYPYCFNADQNRFVPVVKIMEKGFEGLNDMASATKRGDYLSRIEELETLMKKAKNADDLYVVSRGIHKIYDGMLADESINGGYEGNQKYANGKRKIEEYQDAIASCLYNAEALSINRILSEPFTDFICKVSFTSKLPYLS